ncbi:MAG: hypothetical protein KDI72_01030, partial [Xanthomonadales bacterium]|nr:hypothetical protein [Xanthomonadales bacterium]
MTLSVAIADNPRPLPNWTIVPKLSPDPVCLCVHGATPCSEAWLTAARAQLAGAAELALLGASAALPGHAQALRLADLVDERPEVLAEAV